MVFPDVLAAAQFSVWLSRYCLNLLLLIKKGIKGLPAMHSVKWFVFLLFHILLFSTDVASNKTKEKEYNLNPPVCVEFWQNCELNMRNYEGKHWFFFSSILCVRCSSGFVWLSSPECVETEYSVQHTAGQSAGFFLVISSISRQEGGGGRGGGKKKKTLWRQDNL